MGLVLVGILYVFMIIMFILNSEVNVFKYFIPFRRSTGAVLVPEWSKGADCKPAIREFESHPALKS